MYLPAITDIQKVHFVMTWMTTFWYLVISFVLEIMVDVSIGLENNIPQLNKHSLFCAAMAFVQMIFN